MQLRFPKKKKKIRDLFHPASRSFLLGFKFRHLFIHVVSVRPLQLLENACSYENVDSSTGKIHRVDYKQYQF